MNDCQGVHAYTDHKETKETAKTDRNISYKLSLSLEEPDLFTKMPFLNNHNNKKIIFHRHKQTYHKSYATFTIMLLALLSTLLVCTCKARWRMATWFSAPVEESAFCSSTRLLLVFVLSSSTVPLETSSDSWWDSHTFTPTSCLNFVTSLVLLLRRYGSKSPVGSVLLILSLRLLGPEEMRSSSHSSSSKTGRAANSCGVCVCVHAHAQQYLDYVLYYNCSKYFFCSSNLLRLSTIVDIFSLAHFLFGHLS